MPKLSDSVKHASRILSRRGSTLGHLYAHSRELLDLQAVIRDSIPGDIFVASCTEGTLHLITPSSALATRLRYSKPQLITTLRRYGIENIDNVRISVRPDFTPHKASERKPALPPSPESARYIESTAQYIEDEPLRKALIRLSRRGSDS